MPKLTGSLAAVTSVPTEGYVTARSVMLRPSGSVVVTGEPSTSPITDGKFELPDVHPGPIQITLTGDGITHDLQANMPDGDADLLELVDDTVDWSPEVVNAARQAAREAAASARLAQEGADRVGSAERVLEAEEASAASAVDAERSAGRSADSAAQSASSAVLAGEHEESARGILGDTQSSASAASDSASEAAQSASAASDAQGKAEAAQSAADAAAAQSADDRSAVGSARNMTGRMRDEAVAARDEAKQHAEYAANSCSDAQDAATNAASDVRDELNGIKTDAQDAASASATSASASAGSAEEARLSAESAAEVVDSGVADATTTIKGKLKLAGDLSGTAEAPTVPGLGDKASKQHTHSIGDVKDLQATVDAVSKATYQATPNLIVKRGSDGTTAVGTPTGSQHAANKGYVDQRVDAATADRPTRSQVDDAIAAKIQLVDALPSSPDPSVLYLVREDA